MFVLRDIKYPNVTQALLQQLTDHRQVDELMGLTEIAKPHALRVCDIAFNTLANNLNVDSSKRVTMFINNKRRDEIIQKTLSELKLTQPE